MPFEIGAWFDEKFQFHLFELAHAKNEIARRNFIAESLSDLSDAEGQPARCRVEDVLEVREYALSCFGSQVCIGFFVDHRTNCCFEHHVKRAWFGQIYRPTLLAFSLHMIGTPTALTFATIDQRIGKSRFVSRMPKGQFVR